ncbi:hypothetical protein [Fodinicola acaciae]|uniref:hypothetical protein n=1 Tax=Fodinicola acaciae TaxID=2681555 RepID=UPI0013D39FF1|nr:hypothetical protein [Fodinicola acaciae]
MRRDDRLKRLPQLLTRYADLPVGVVEVQPAEDRAVEDLAYTRLGAAIQLARPLQQLQGRQQHFVASGQVATGGFELATDAGDVFPHALQPSFELGLGPGRVAETVQVAVFFGIQLHQPFGQLRTNRGRALLTASYSRQRQPFDGFPLARRDADGRVVRFHRPLDLSHRYGRQVTFPYDQPSADEVEVLPSRLAGARPQHDAVPTAVAPQRALQIVVMMPLSRPGIALDVQHPLHPLE